MSAIVMPPNVEPLTVSVELQPYQAHPIDNALLSEKEINRFFMGDESTIGLINVLKGMNVFTLAECCMVAGPRLWRLCAFMHPEFGRLFHCCGYKGSERDDLKSLTAARIAVRKVFTDFYSRWAKLQSHHGDVKVTSYENQWGQLMNPVHPADWPAFRSYSESVPNEFIEQWFDGKGGLSRWKVNSKGEVVDRKFGFPCSVVSRSTVIDRWYEFDVTVNDFVQMQEYGTKISLTYQTFSGRHISVQVIPDSEFEFWNFIENGCHARHPLVTKFCPSLVPRLESETDPE